jgi:CDGSH-type Zn-finger protein
LPQTYTAPSSRTLYFCGCKHTKSAPLCDGAHNAL